MSDFTLESDRHETTNSFRLLPRNSDTDSLF